METQECKFCKSQIRVDAAKCPNCAEWINEKLKPNRSSTAAVLSLILPGVGQIYKGQPFNGLLWFVMTVLAYMFFWPAGLGMHLLCVVGASMR